MRKSILVSPFVATLALASSAGATVMYVSPTGTAAAPCCTTRDMPCDLSSAAAAAVAGDTVILMDGVYKTHLYVTNSGTASSWITFKADECSTPIIEGPGVGPMDDNQDTGVGSAEATYVRFVGIVSRGWNSGFGNGWTGEGTTNSNGNWEIVNCVGDGNGRTGFTFFSATGLHLKNSIAAHNGSSVVHSWSSGITLYASGSGDVIDGNISFENMDAEQHTDGSGFIVNVGSNDATFINNVAFRNGGSCLRLTTSSGTKFLNNTCYHDALDTADDGPPNPGEVYFTQESTNSTITGVTFMNNAFVNTGTGPGMTNIYNKPTTGWSNNVESTGTVTVFTDPEGTNPDFTLSASSSLIGKGAANAAAPMNDAGFDPKCIVKKTPALVGMIASASWWQYSVDIDYIKSIGGVAQCFHPKARSGTPDIGAYSNGAVTRATAGSCTPPTTGAGGMGGMPTCSAGAAGAAGAATGGMSAGGAGPVAGASPGGTPGVGGMGVPGGAPATAGNAPTAGTTTVGSGGMTGAAGSATNSGTGGASSSAGGSMNPPTSGGTGAGTGTGSAGKGGAAPPGGCGCRVTGQTPRSTSLAAFGLMGLGLLGFRRRRSAR